MNCQKCGGPVSPTSNASFVSCGYCGGLTPIAGRSSGRDGLVFLGGSVGAGCPTCLTPLVTATLDAAAVAGCTTCSGFLITRDAFTGLTAERRANWSGGDRLPQPFEGTELDVRRDCPRCDAPFETYPFCGPGNVVIDCCRDCDLIWLDAAELIRIERAPGAREQYLQPIRVSAEDEADVRPTGPAETAFGLLATILD